MAKWNPFEKHILRADPDEFSSGDGEYGTVHDAENRQDMNPANAAPSQELNGGGTVPSPEAAADNGDAQTPASGDAQDMWTQAPDNTADVRVPYPDNGGDAEAPPSDQNAAVPGSTMSEGQPTGSDAAGSSHMPDQAAPAYGEAPGRGTPAYGDTPGQGAPGSDAAAGAAFSGQNSYAGTQDSGTAAHFSSGHDFDDDEPKFDTQTGERLDKPKKKLPAMILTVVVSIFAICAFIFSLRLGGSVSDKKAEENEPEETETHLAIAVPSSEAETEKESETDAETQSHQTETGAAIVSGTQHETETEAAGKNRTGNGADVQSADHAGSQNGVNAHSKAHAESETGTETETETETEYTDSVPQFRTEGITVSASLDVADLVEEAMPGVVSVTATNVQTVRDFFYGLKEIKQTDAGSGIIAGRDDSFMYIVTDGSIVSGAQDVTVGFCVKKEFTKELTDDDTVASAEVIGVDGDSMLAVIKVPLDKINGTVLPMLKTAVLGDSDKLRVGQRVIAIGNAMGHGLSVTQGIVSAVNRQMRYGSSVHNFIQTDASINYGNYGGALLNEAGEVIGINAGKISDNASEGMGFAFPVNDVRKAVGSLLPGGDGRPAETEAEDAKPETEQAKTPEDKEEKELLTLALAQDESETGEPDMEKTGDDGTVSSETEKAGTKEQDTGTTGTEKAAAQESGAGEQSEASAPQGQLGVHVGEFSKEDQIIYRIPKGAVIADVTAGSGAQQAGLASGDLITAINEEEVASVDELKAALSGLKAGDRVKVSFVRPDEDNAYRDDNVTSVMVTLQ